MGKVILSGVSKGMTKPIRGILANTLAVGSSVYLMENGAAAEYLVVHQGLPSSMYDASCDGCWLLRKDCYDEMAVDADQSNIYENSDIHIYLNSTFLGLFSSKIQGIIRQAKIPYYMGGGFSGSLASGANGLQTKVFLLGGCEVGFSGLYHVPEDGSKLDYFESGDTSSTNNAKRIAYLNGDAKYWWLRSPSIAGDVDNRRVNNDGSSGQSNTIGVYGIRPALILPSTALFDKNTLILKGVA